MTGQLFSYDSRKYECQDSPNSLSGEAFVLFKEYRGRPFWFIDHLFVGSAKRRQGIGTRLMEAVIADADAARMQIVLYIDARNYLICSPGHYFDGPGKQASASFLRRWYGTFGFISDSDALFKLGIFTTGVTDLIWMVREPELPIREPTEDLTPMEMWLKLGFVRTDAANT